jgi:hypothetical protein
MVNTPFAMGGRKDPSLCGVTTKLDIQAEMRALGRYQADVTKAVATCTVLHYAAGTQPDAIASCGPTRTSTDTWRAAVWCDGVDTTGWPGGHTYTEDECGTGTGRAWSCTSPGYMVAGHPGRTQVLDDGMPVPIVWDEYRFTGGVKSQTGWETRFEVDEASTPVDPAAELGAGKGWAFGNTRSVTATFQAAGLPDRPYTVYRDGSFRGQFLRQVTTVTSIDINTGEWATTRSPRWVPGVGSCTSQPAVIDVYRARNDR